MKSKAAARAQFVFFAATFYLLVLPCRALAWLGFGRANAVPDGCSFKANAAKSWLR